MMREPVIRTAGVVGSALYAGIIGWLFLSQPQTLTEAVGSLSASVGVYRIDEQAFEDGLRFFRADQFAAARAAFARADPAQQDARTQFYVSYSYYREGWGRTHSDDALFSAGLAAVERAIAASPNGRIVVDDTTIVMRTADELKAELEAGLRTDASDFNPLRVFESRK
jgi:hypothetical protein